MGDVPAKTLGSARPGEYPAGCSRIGEVVGDADGVLGEESVVVGVRMGRRAAEILQVIVRDFVSVGAQRREIEPALHGLESERIDFDGIEKIFAALLSGEKVVDRRKKGVAAQFPRVARAFVTYGFREVQTMLAGLAGKKVGASHAVEDGRNL